MGTDLRGGDLRSRLPGILAIVLIAALGIQAIAFAAQKGNAYDEIIDIAAGYAYLRTGNYRLCPEHPALATAVTAAPLLLLDMQDPRGDPDYRTGTRWEFALRTLHENRTSGKTILLLARLPSILLAAALGWLLFRIGRREFGPWGGVAGLFLLATSPTFIAHSALATGDSILTVAAFASFVTLRRCLQEITWPRLVVAGAALGAALAVKMTAFVLLPVGVIIAATTRPAGEGPPPAWSARLPDRWRPYAPKAIALVLILLIALISIQAVYLWRFVGGTGEGPTYLHDPGTLGPRGGLGGGVLAAMAWVFPGEYVYGLRELMQSSAIGWPHFLLGETGKQAPWWAYPCAAALKTRGALIVGFAISILGWGLLRLRWALLLHLLCLPVLLITILVAGSGYHGVRILLPACPFLFLVIGGAAGTWAARVPSARVVVGAGLLAAALPCLLAFPDYLAYQNGLVGGKETDYRRLVDSDLDWGQDLPALEEELERLGSPTIHLRYFGTDDPRRYGFSFDLLSGCDPVKGTVAISATHLQGVYLDDPHCYRWLEGLTPIGRAGRSILIFRIP